ncbi:LacI family DNA-binding transcriptional regulator, partial [Roseibium sp.]
MKANLSDVAKEAGVSAITVSRALRHPDKVSKKTLDKIMSVVDRLGYIPDPAARALAVGKTNV